MKPVAETLEKYRHRPLGRPVNIIALATPISGDRRDDRDRALALTLAVVSSVRQERYHAHEIGFELCARRLEGDLAGRLIRQRPVCDEHRVDSTQAPLA